MEAYRSSGMKALTLSIGLGMQEPLKALVFGCCASNGCSFCCALTGTAGTAAVLVMEVGRRYCADVLLDRMAGLPSCSGITDKAAHVSHHHKRLQACLHGRCTGPCLSVCLPSCHNDHQSAV